MTPSGTVILLQRHGSLRLAAATLLVGCAGRGDDGSAGLEELEAIACTVSELDARVESTAISTVPRVRWTAPDGATAARVAFVRADDQVYRTPETTEESALLLGLRERSAVPWRLLVDVDGETWCTPVEYAETGALPAQLPSVTVSSPNPVAARSGFVVTSAFTEQGSYLVILDHEGHYVWAMSVSTVAFGAALSRVTGDLLYLVDARSAEEDGQFVRVSLDGEQVVETPCAGCHTSFEELPDGTIVLPRWHIEEMDDDGTPRKILGDDLVLLDGAEVVELWDAFEELELDLDAAFFTGWYNADDEVESWTHLNHVGYDEEQDLVLATLGGSDPGIVAVDRATGATAWRMMNGALNGDIALDGGHQFGLPHSAGVDEQGRLVVFERNLDDVCAGVTWTEFDTEARTGAVTQRYDGGDCLVVSFLGEALPLEGGNTLVVFTGSGRIDQVGPAGDTVWTLQAGVGGGYGFSDHVTTLQ